MVKQFIMLFSVFKRQLVETPYVLSILYTAAHVVILQGIIELSSPKSFRSQLDLCNIINF